jgi:hypothetical protein
MRKLFTIFCALFAAGQLAAQAPLIDGKMQQYVDKQLTAKQVPAQAVERYQEQMAQRMQSASLRGGDASSYLVAYVDAVANSGSVPGLVRATLWPDSLARIADPEGDFYWFIHAMTDIFDPNSLLINDTYIEDEISVQFRSGNVYELDSFAFYYLYSRVSAPSIVDTLRVYLFGEPNISEQNFTDWPNAGDVTDVTYARYNNALFRPNTSILYSFEYLLTSADTSTAFLARISEGINTTLAKNSKIGAAFHFIPGQSYSLGDVLFDNSTGAPGVLNNFDLVTYFEDDGLFPISSITDEGALNQGGIVETSIRYGLNPLGWNIAYYPAFGFGAGWLSEHVLTEWSVSPIGAHFTAGGSGVPCQIQFSDRSNVTAIDGWDWSFGDAGGSIAIDVENPVCTYPANGTYTVELTVSGDEGNFSYERNVAVTSCGIGFNELEGLTNFDIFPSPATDFVSINVGLSTAQDLEVGVFNAQGQLVLSDRIQGALNYQHSFDVSTLAEGLYQIKLQNGDRFSTKAFIVQ